MTDRPIIVFDVNETLLDLDTIRPTFERIFDDPAAMRLWFANLIPVALRRLRDHGFRLFTLTDNTLEISGRQLEQGGIIDLFERYPASATVDGKKSPRAFSNH